MHPSLTPPPADALLFDWDGTLADSQDANYRAMSCALSIAGIHLDKEWSGSRTGISSAEMIALLARERGVTLPVPVDDLAGRRDARFPEEVTSIRPHAAVPEVVEAAHGGTPMAIASGGSREIILATLRHPPFRSSFDAIVTRGDVTRGKPAPDIFLNAAAALNADPARCVVHEDSDKGISAARAAGMRVIDVRPCTGRGTTGPRGTSTPAQAEAGLPGHWLAGQMPPLRQADQIEWGWGATAVDLSVRYRIVQIWPGVRRARTRSCPPSSACSASWATRP